MIRVAVVARIDIVEQVAKPAIGWQSASLLSFSKLKWMKG